MSKVGFIGLGTMGYPMAGHISKSFTTFVFNRTKTKSQKWMHQYKGTVCQSVADLSQRSDIIFLCLSRDCDVHEIICGNGGILENVKPGSIIVDHSTTSKDLTLNMKEQLQDHKCFYLDAPVSGGEVGAQQATLSIMVGGEKNSYKKITPILDCYSNFHKYMGVSGNGQLTKMINQICIAGLIQALAEAVNFAKKSGVPPKEVLEVISKGAAQSWQMENRWESMVNNEYDFGFAVDMMVKDLEIISEFSKRIGADISLTETIKTYYNELQEMGAGSLDTSSLLRRLDRS